MVYSRDCTQAFSPVPKQTAVWWLLGRVLKLFLASDGEILETMDDVCSEIGRNIS